MMSNKADERTPDPSESKPIADTSELDSKLREIEIHRPPTIEGKTIVTSRLSNKEITQIKAILDTEIAKARVEELEMFASSYLTDAGHKYLTKRYKQLKGEDK